MEARTVERRDPGRFLPAVLEGVQTKRDEAGRNLGVPDAEDAASSRSLSSSKGLVENMRARPSAVCAAL
jgi:hypothetical protein